MACGQRAPIVALGFTPTAPSILNKRKRSRPIGSLAPCTRRAGTGGLRSPQDDGQSARMQGGVGPLAPQSWGEPGSTPVSGAAGAAPGRALGPGQRVGGRILTAGPSPILRERGVLGSSSGLAATAGPAIGSADRSGQLGQCDRPAMAIQGRHWWIIERALPHRDRSCERVAASESDTLWARHFAPSLHHSGRFGMTRFGSILGETDAWQRNHSPLRGTSIRSGGAGCPRSSRRKCGGRNF
jgi:hypothetical protein